MPQIYSQCPHCHSLNRVKSELAQTKSPVCGKCGKELSIHGNVCAVNTANFRKIISRENGQVVIDFWAPWCGPCRSYAPEFEKASKENPAAIFLKVNVDEEPELANLYGVRGIPCTVVLKDGKEYKRQSGMLPAQAITQLLS